MHYQGITLMLEGFAMVIINTVSAAMFNGAGVQFARHTSAGCAE